MISRNTLNMSRYLVLAVVLVSSLALLVPISMAKADSLVNFPDANLKAAVRNALGKPEPVGDIYESDLVALTTFSADSQGIVDLTGLEYCTSLTSLSLNGDNISNLAPLFPDLRA